MVCTHYLSGSSLESPELSERSKSAKSFGVATGATREGGVVSRASRAMRLAYVGVYTLVVAALFGGLPSLVMAQDPWDGTDIPELVQTTSVLNALISAITDFIGPVILFLLGLAVLYMFMKMLAGRKRVG